jgi:hypothetical protein
MQNLHHYSAGSESRLDLFARQCSIVAPNRNPVFSPRDAVTSQVSAEHFTRSGARDYQKARLTAFMRANPAPRRRAEVAAAPDDDRHSVTRRMPDLKRDRFVEHAGMRECRISLRLVTIWRAR